MIAVVGAGLAVASVIFMVKHKNDKIQRQAQLRKPVHMVLSIHTSFIQHFFWCIERERYKKEEAAWLQLEHEQNIKLQADLKLGHGKPDFSLLNFGAAQLTSCITRFLDLKIKK
jgi:hypothetical protein